MPEILMRQVKGSYDACRLGHREIKKATQSLAGSPFVWSLFGTKENICFNPIRGFDRNSR
jgi:hypothetical protein